MVYTDASSTGYAGYVAEHGGHIAHGQWSESEKEKSSTWRELAAVDRVLKSICRLLEGSRVKWFTDNNMVRIISVGSRVSELQVLALSIFRSTMEKGLSIELEWVPREDNHHWQII